MVNELLERFGSLDTTNVRSEICIRTSRWMREDSLDERGFARFTEEATAPRLR